jgi:hypothetical protein
MGAGERVHSSQKAPQFRFSKYPFLLPFFFFFVSASEKKSQLGLYHTALGHPDRAVQAFNKALFIFPESIPATVHLSHCYLTLAKEGSSDTDNVDLVAGMLSDLTQGPGWDVPEAWYFLGEAHGMREMRDRERECLGFAFGLAEGRPLRDFGEAVGWCL